MAREQNILKKIDLPLLLMYLALAFMGLLTIYSSSFDEEFPAIYDWNKPYGKQLFWIVFSCLLGGVILLMDSILIKKSSYLVYGIVILMLIAVLATPPINGARSWFQMGSFSLQPSEFSKFTSAMAIAFYMSQINVKLQDIRTKTNVLLLLAIPGALILIQPDAGTLLVFFSFIFVMYREGLSGNILLITLFGLVISILSVYIASFETAEVNEANINQLIAEGLYSASKYTDIPRGKGFYSNNYTFSLGILVLGAVSMLLVKTLVLPRYRKSYYPAIIISTLGAVMIVIAMNWSFDAVFKNRHRSRFQIMFGVKEDRQGDGYNIYQALSAVGSGEFAGKGFLKGTLSNEKYKHVPEQSTDFIFCSWSEEWGFTGNTVLIALYISFLIRIVMIAERQRSKYNRIFGYSVASILFFHFMINIAMVIGIAPVIGIPLPFFSKGGSSILSFSIMIFILLRLDAGRTEELY